MKESNEKNTIKEIIETGSEISGGIGGAVIGGLIAGPVGAMLGGASGPIISKAFKVLGLEIKNRFLGTRENIRIGAAYAFAINKINENEFSGRSLRDDDFFKEIKNNRAASEEVLEGIILSSQREFEELKIKFLGNLYANVCFRADISKQHINQLIKTADSLTFRQFCILQLMNERYNESLNLNVKLRGLDRWEISIFDIVAEVRDLHQRGLLNIPNTHDAGDNSSPIQLNRLSITKSGLFFCEILSLEEIEKETLDDLNRTTSIREK